MNRELESNYRALASRDARFDGVIFPAVRTTGVFCRPSCPAPRPKPHNVRFYRTAAAAQAAGYRACKRCRPDTAPDSPAWQWRDDVVARCLELIADGIVDREGTAGLASRLGFTERHVRRLLEEGVGAGPAALARSRRLRVSRRLIELTGTPFGDVAVAAGFGSVRQFNAAVRQYFGLTPTELRRRTTRPPDAAGASGAVTMELELDVRRPADFTAIVGTLRAQALAGVEEVTDDGSFRRALRLPNGLGIAEIRAAERVRVRLDVDDLRDVAVALQRCRRLLDLDADPFAVDTILSADASIAALVAARPGLRVAGTVDPAEFVLRTALAAQGSGEQVRDRLAQVVCVYGSKLAVPRGAVTHAFPEPRALSAGLDLDLPTMTRGRVHATAAALVDGRLQVEPGCDPRRAESALRELDFDDAEIADIAMRALRDPDACPPELGLTGCRPFRAYAAAHLVAADAAPGSAAA